MVGTKEKFISLISDTTFKYLFKNENTKDFFISIIKSKFNIDLNEYELTSEEDNTGSKVKDYRMDLVFYKKDTNEYIIIEATSSKKFSQLKLNQTHQYLFRVVSRGYDTGKTYKNAPKVRLIEFNNYIRNDIPELCMTATYNLSSKETGLIYDDITIHEIYLPKYHKLCYNKLDEINKKLWMFSAESFDEYKDIHDENEKIVKELRRLSMDSKFVDDYDRESVQRKILNSYCIEAREEGYNSGYDSGINDGIEQQKNKERLEIAKKMLIKEADVEYISEITGLSINEINDLK